MFGPHPSTPTTPPENADAASVVEWARQQFGPRLCMATSFNDTVLLDVVMSVDANIPVFFADTGFHFAETLATMKAAQVRYRLDLRVVRPQPAALSLWADGTEACCRSRKVQPLLQAMSDQGFVAWMTGLRRAESTTRAAAPVVGESANGLAKIAPLATWTDDDVARYVAGQELIANPLTAQGYPSIGCWPCTQPAVGDDPRAGRWVGSAKTECGLHLVGQVGT